MQEIKRPGVYQIVNKLNGKVYIGQAKNIYVRWRKHRYSAVNPNEGRLIARAFRKYGLDNFHFGVLEFCDEADLDRIEQEWLDLVRPFGSRGYNLAVTAGSNRGYKQPSVSVLRRAAAISKKIYKYDLSTGKIIEEFNSVREAGESVGRNPSAIGNAAKGRVISCAGYGWAFAAQDCVKVDSYGKGSAGKSPVIKFDKSGNRLAEYKSLSEASVTDGISVGKISEVCSGKRKTAGGYIWRYLDK